MFTLKSRWIEITAAVSSTIIEPLHSKIKPVNLLIQWDFRQKLDCWLCECVCVCVFGVAFMLVSHTVLLCMFSLICAQCVKEQEKLLAQRKVPGLQSQLEEFKSAICQLQGQKQRLQTEVGHAVTLTTAGCQDIFIKDFSKKKQMYCLEDRQTPLRLVQTPVLSDYFRDWLINQLIGWCKM